MSSPVAILPRISHKDYLDMEAISPIKHEYVAGQMYAMTGTSDVHNVIAGNRVVPSVKSNDFNDF